MSSDEAVPLPQLMMATQGETVQETPTATMILQTVEGRQFPTLAEAATYLKALDVPTRKQYVSNQATKLIDLQEKVDTHLGYLDEFVDQDEAFKNRMEEDPETWKQVKEGAVRAKARGSKKDEAMKKCFSVWGEKEVLYHFEHLMNKGDTTWSKVRRLALKTELVVAIMSFRNAVLWRVTNPGRGRDSITLEPVAADFDRVEKGDSTAFSTQRVCGAGYAIGGLVPAERVLAIGEADEDEEERENDPLADILDNSGEKSGEQGGVVEQEENNRNPGLRLRPKGVRSSDASLDQEGDDRDEAQKSASTTEHLPSEEDTSEYEETEYTGDEIEREAFDREDGHQSKKTKLTKDGAYKCGCDGSLPAWFVQKCTAKNVVNPGNQVKLVKEWVAHRDAGRDTCFQHTHNIASVLGFQTRMLGAGTVKDRLLRYHEAAQENLVGDLKVNKETYSWFRMASRPHRPSDRLGPYKLQPLESETFSITEGDQERLRKYFKIDGAKWDAEGSVVVDCFQWWSEVRYTGDNAELRGCTIMDVVLEEFDMYHAHLREINGKLNYGWLRNMYYSLGQQVMRQDPAYFGIYCALRPDRNTNLISFPYYAKYSHAGDSTYFRHIDINIKNLANSGRGANMIQGTVSLDNEREDDCTMILPGMHKHIKEWEEVLEERGLSTTSLVHKVKNSMFTEEDEKRFSTKWTPQPCTVGQVRVTVPHLPHGACGPAKGVRRTMLSWFCGLQKDLEVMEVIESGTWSDLSVAHRDLVAARLSPSGLANRYGAIPFAFPAAVELVGLGAISDALVCRRRHDKFAVVNEKAELLKGSDKDRDRLLGKWRAKAVNAVCDAFELVKTGEMSKFGDKSFFTRKMQGLSPAASDDDPDPSLDSDIATHGFEEPEADKAQAGGEEANDSMDIDQKLDRAGPT